jgi:oligopeptide/dipeptide ABC transporter ATP-binding protein
LPEPVRVLDVRDLRTSFFTSQGEFKAVDGVSYHVDRGEIVAIAGESGCGKSVTQMSVLQLVQSPPGRILGGSVMFEGQNLLALAPRSKTMRQVRGGGIAMIFQEPMTSLNPVLTVGRQLCEVVAVHAKISRRRAWRRGLAALEAVGISDAEQRMRNYPFEMSGGMRQRVMIATAIACNAKLIVADEPTTALDVTTQAQVMELLLNLVKKDGKSLVIITHNLGLIARYAQRVYVMYAGKIIESGTTEALLTGSKHPYTLGLLNSIPRLEVDTDTDLAPIIGAPPSLNERPAGCAFEPRCPFAQSACRSGPFPEMRRVGPSDHYVACHREIDGRVTPVRAS